MPLVPGRVRRRPVAVPARPVESLLAAKSLLAILPATMARMTLGLAGLRAFGPLLRRGSIARRRSRDGTLRRRRWRFRSSAPPEMLAALAMLAMRTRATLRPSGLPHLDHFRLGCGSRRR